MEFNTFTEEVKAAVQNRLPESYKDVEFTLNENYKLNDHYMGLTAHIPGQTISPTVNLNAYHEKYEQGMSMDEIADRIAEAIQQEPEVEVDIDNLLTYDKSKLFIRVSDIDANRDTLAGVPYTKVENLAITYHVVASQGKDGIASTIVNDQLMNQYGITKEQLHQDAMENSPKIMPARITSMEQVMREMMSADLKNTGMSQDEIDTMLDGMIPSGENPMTVVTNEQSINGAAVMFYPNVMDQLGEQVGGNFFVLPSSVHECLVLPDNGEMSYRELKAMVTDINATQVEPKDRLADEVYHYDVQEHVFERADRFETRMQEKEAAKGKEDISENKSLIGRLNEKKEQIADKPKNPTKAATKQHNNDLAM